MVVVCKMARSSCIGYNNVDVVVSAIVDRGMLVEACLYWQQHRAVLQRQRRQHNYIHVAHNRHAGVDMQKCPSRGTGLHHEVTNIKNAVENIWCNTIQSARQNEDDGDTTMLKLSRPTPTAGQARSPKPARLSSGPARLDCLLPDQP